MRAPPLDVTSTYSCLWDEESGRAIGLAVNHDAVLLTAEQGLHSVGWARGKHVIGTKADLNFPWIMTRRVTERDGIGRAKEMPGEGGLLMARLWLTKVKLSAMDWLVNVIKEYRITQQSQLPFAAEIYQWRLDEATSVLAGSNDETPLLDAMDPRFTRLQNAKMAMELHRALKLKIAWTENFMQRHRHEILDCGNPDQVANAVREAELELQEHDQ